MGGVFGVGPGAGGGSDRPSPTTTSRAARVAAPSTRAAKTTSNLPGWRNVNDARYAPDPSSTADTSVPGAIPGPAKWNRAPSVRACAPAMCATKSTGCPTEGLAFDTSTDERAPLVADPVAAADGDAARGGIAGATAAACISVVVVVVVVIGVVAAVAVADGRCVEAVRAPTSPALYATRPMMSAPAAKHPATMSSRRPLPSRRTASISVDSSAMVVSTKDGGLLVGSARAEGGGVGSARAEGGDVASTAVRVAGDC